MKIEKLKSKFFTGAFITDVKQYFGKINEIIDYLNGVKGEGSYKEYTGIISQVGTDAPTVTIQVNTLGTIVWTRDSFGIYFGTLLNAFPLSKTHLYLQPYGRADEYTSSFIYGISREDSDIICISVADGGGGIDDSLFSRSFSIKVYN